MDVTLQDDSHSECQRCVGTGAAAAAVREAVLVETDAGSAFDSGQRALRSPSSARGQDRPWRSAQVRAPPPPVAGTSAEPFSERQSTPSVERRSTQVRQETQRVSPRRPPRPVARSFTNERSTFRPSGGSAAGSSRRSSRCRSRHRRELPPAAPGHPRAGSPRGPGQADDRRHRLGAGGSTFTAPVGTS